MSEGRTLWGERVTLTPRQRLWRLVHWRVRLPIEDLVHTMPERITGAWNVLRGKADWFEIDY